MVRRYAEKIQGGILRSHSFKVQCWKMFKGNLLLEFYYFIISIQVIEYSGIIVAHLFFITVRGLGLAWQLGQHYEGYSANANLKRLSIWGQIFSKSIQSLVNSTQCTLKLQRMFDDGKKKKKCCSICFTVIFFSWSKIICNVTMVTIHIFPSNNKGLFLVCNIN